MAAVRLHRERQRRRAADRARRQRRRDRRLARRGRSRRRSRRSTCCRPRRRKAGRSSTARPRRAKPASRSSSTCRSTSPHTPIVPTAELAGQERARRLRRLRDADRRGRRPGRRRAATQRAGRTTRWSSSPATTAAHPSRRASPSWPATGQQPSDLFRGHKADVYEGGHRVPFLVRWPGEVKPGTHVRPDDLPDRPDGDRRRDRRREAARRRRRGQRQPPAGLLDGTADGPVREATVHHSINGSFAIRQGKWKLILAPAPAAGACRRPPRRTCRPCSSTTSATTRAKRPVARGKAGGRRQLRRCWSATKATAAACRGARPATANGTRRSKGRSRSLVQSSSRPASSRCWSLPVICSLAR